MFDVFEKLVVFWGLAIVIYILYFMLINELIPRLKGEMSLSQKTDKFLEDSILKDNSELLDEREATLKEKLYFQNIKGGFFVSFFILAFFIFIFLLDIYTVKYSLIFLFLSIISLYLKLFTDLKKVGQISKKVKTIRGTVRKIHMKRSRYDTDRLLSIGDEDYYVSSEFEMPEYASYVEIEVYDDIELVRINEQKLLENINLEELKNSKFYHKAIAVTFFITTILSFLILYDDIYTNLSMNILSLDKKEVEYINANSIRKNPPKIGQRIDISGYRVCKTENCKLFLLLDRPVKYEIDKNLEAKIEIQKDEINRIKEEIFHENTKKIHDAFNKKLLSGKMPDVYKYNKDLRDAARNVPYKGIDILDVEKHRLENIINNRFLSEDNQVIIKYLTYTNSFESKAHFNAKTYQDLVEEIDHSTRVYGLKLIVYNYSKKITINGKEATLITVIDDLSDEEILDHQLISLYLFILIFLTLVHAFLGFRKKTTAREKELANRIIEYDK